MSAVDPSDEVRWETVGERAELAATGRLQAKARGWQLLLLLVDDTVYAVENRCSHATAKLDSGELDGCHLICPLHGARFDVRDGSCAGPPATQPIRSFEARFSGEQVEVAVPEKPALPKPKFGVFN